MPVAQRMAMHKLSGLASLMVSALLACGGQVGGSGSGTPDGGKPSPDAAHERDSSSPVDSASSRDSGVDARRPRDSGEDSRPPIRVPVNHRPNDSECVAPAPPGDCNETELMTSCSADSQCTASDAGTDGRCITDGPIAGCHCAYDSCAGDTDCAIGQLCVCHGSPYSSGGNTCMPGNCRVDGDCGPQGYCSPSPSGGCGGVGGYYCHTAADTCVSDGDCGDLGEDTCVWSPASERWECQMAELCG